LEEKLTVYVPVVANKPEPDDIVILYNLPAIEVGAVTDELPLLLLPQPVNIVDITIRNTIFIFFIFLLHALSCSKVIR